jgi:hypothetical protein
MRTLKNILKLVFLAIGATVLLFLPSYLGEGGKWVIPGALVVLIGIKYRKNVFVNAAKFLLLLAAYMNGGAQYGLPSQITDILAGADMAVTQLETVRRSQIEGAQSLVLSTTGIVKLAVDRFQKPINITQVQAKTEPEPKIEATPTLEPTLVPPQPEVEVQVTLTWDGTTCQEVEIEVQAERANLRQEPSIFAKILAVIEKGEKVSVSKSNPDGWVQVDFFGTEGWMNQSTLGAFTCKAP